MSFTGRQTGSGQTGEIGDRMERMQRESDILVSIHPCLLLVQLLLIFWLFVLFRFKFYFTFVDFKAIGCL